MREIDEVIYQASNINYNDLLSSVTYVFPQFLNCSFLSIHICMRSSMRNNDLTNFWFYLPVVAYVWCMQWVIYSMCLCVCFVFHSYWTRIFIKDCVCTCLFFVWCVFRWMNDEQFDLLTPSLLQGRPNTYTFTKALAENLLQEEASDLPVAIIRPSIIGAAVKEPFTVRTFFLLKVITSIHVFHVCKVIICAYSFHAVLIFFKHLWFFL